MTDRLGVWVLQGLLTGLGLAMAVASRRVRRLRRQVTRDLLVEVRSQDGARQAYRLHAATRRLSLARAGTGPPECALVFPDAWTGLRTLLSGHTIGRIMHGMNYGDTRIEGNPVLLLWFHGLTRVVAPIGSTRRPRRDWGRRPAAVPVRAPEYDAPYAHRLVREPAEPELSRDWPQAWAARETLLQVRAARGERLPPG